jgi:hypothetical protein
VVTTRNLAFARSKFCFQIVLRLQGLPFHISLLQSLSGNPSRHCNYSERYNAWTSFIEPFSELTDIELASAVHCIPEPSKCPQNMHKLLMIKTVNKDVSYRDETKLPGCDHIEDIDGWPVLVYD